MQQLKQNQESERNGTELTGIVNIKTPNWGLVESSSFEIRN
jgi:hypothetical protein